MPPLFYFGTSCLCPCTFRAFSLSTTMSVRLQPALAVVGTLVVAAIVYKRVFQRASNPFARDARRAPETLPTDIDGYEKMEQQKHKLLKNIYRPQKVPSRLDAIVIGSGAGGMTCAALMAKAGKKVLVLEQHDLAGGCCHSFTDKGYKFDPGIHYIGEMTDKSILGFLVNQITEGQLQWAPLDEEYDTLMIQQPDGTRREIPIKAGKRLQCLKDHFPAEADAITQWSKHLKQAKGTTRVMLLFKLLPKPLAWLALRIPYYGPMFRKAFELAATTTQEIAERLTQDKDLRAAFHYNWGDYGTPPRQSSFFMQAMICNHYEHGAFYPVGGSDSIPASIVPVITKSGGAVLVKAPVEKILVKGNRAVGVKMKSGGAEIYAPLIISDAGLLNTMQRLLPAPLQKPVSAKHPNSISFISLFVGLKGSAAELGLDKRQVWWLGSNDIDGDLAAFTKKGPEHAKENGFPFLFITFPSAKEPLERMAKPERCTCTIITLMPYQWVDKWIDPPNQWEKRHKDYRKMKTELGRVIWDQTIQIFPQLKYKVDYFEVGTPLTNEFYLQSVDGAMYGIDHCLERFSPENVINLRPDYTGVKGLLLTGQDLFSCGFGAAVVSGALTASVALNRNVVSDLQALMTRCKKGQ